MNNNFDIIIVGGSLAGSSAAVTAAKLGCKVLLLEKAQFPRAKACGEGFSAYGLSALSSIYGEQFLNSLGPISLQGFELKHARRTCLVTSKPDRSAAFGLQRHTLDEACLMEAAKYSEVKQNQAVLETHFDSNQWIIRTSLQTYTCKVLIAADGARSKVGRLNNIEERESLRERYGLSFQVSGVKVPRDPKITIAIKDGYEIYGTWVGKKNLNLAILGPRHLIGQFSQTQFHSSLVSEVCDQVGNSMLIGPALASGPLGIRRLHNKNIPLLLCGDAVESFDPLGGMGMTHAIQSAELAAQTAVKMIKGADYRVEIPAYERSRYNAARTCRGFTRLAKMSMQHLLGNPILTTNFLNRFGAWIESGLVNVDSIAGRLIRFVGS